MKSLNAILGILLSAFISSAAFAQMSGSRIRTLELQQCYSRGCVQATASEASMTLALNALAAQKTRVKILNADGVTTHSFTCAWFRYDLAAQFLSCDNRDVNGQALTIDADLNIRHYDISGGSR